MSSILNKPVPNVNVPVLEPIPYKQIIPKLKTLTRNLAEKNLNNFADWLLSYTPPTIKTKVTESVQKLLNLFPKKIKLQKTAFKGFTKSYEISLVEIDPLKQFHVTENFVEDKLSLDLSKMKGMKATVTLNVIFFKIDKSDEKITREAFFNSKAIIILNNKDIDEMLKTSATQILDKIGKWLSQGSGWMLDHIKGHFVNLVKYSPLNGSSYIELPKELKNPKKVLVNIKNENDNECFR